MMEQLDRFEVPRGSAVVVLVDIQERLLRAMDPDRKEAAVHNTRLLLSLAKTLKLPVMATEQHPRGLGETIPEVRELLPPGAVPIEKVVFSSWKAKGFAERFRALGRSTAILAGMESHVCVLGTAKDMLRAGFNVHVPRDAVLSRTRENWLIGLDLMDRAGVVVTSTETLIFQMLERAGTEEFKEMARLLK